MVLDDGPPDPLEELEFLARSSNRVNVLEAIAQEPTGRYELEEATGVSRATLSRILEDFTDRGWVIEDDREYRATQLGAYVSRELGRLLERFEPVPALNDVAQWFPASGFGFDLADLAGATIVRTTERDALAPTTHIERRIRDADRVRLLTYAVLPGVVDACWRGVVDERLELEAVLATAALEGVAADPELLERAGALLERGATVVVTDGEVPSTVFVVDEAVLLCLSGGEGAPLAVIESDDEAVHAWATATIDEHRRAGQRIDASMFAS